MTLSHPKISPPEHHLYNCFLKKDMFLFLGNKKSRQIGLDISFPPEWGFPLTFLGQPFWGDLFEEN